MRCEREATIHEVIIHQGKKRERHLCEACANKSGLSSDPHLPISQLISSFMLGPLIERAHEGGCHHVGKFPRRALRDCRSLGDRERVEVLLGGQREREERLEAIRKALAKAVRDEDYERAAMLRDELSRVSDLLEDAGGA
jgi:protein-arginine kinase activator protein McsA